MWLGIVNYTYLIPGTYANDVGTIKFTWTKNFVWQESGIELTGTYGKDGDRWEIYPSGGLLTSFLSDQAVTVGNNNGTPAITLYNDTYSRITTVGDVAVVFGFSALLVGGVALTKSIGGKGKKTSSMSTGGTE